MPDTLELIPNENEFATLLFESEEDYIRFREAFIDEVIPLQEEWLEARRKSEEESRQRLLR